MDHEVIRRYSGAGDDARVQFLEQGEAGFFRPAGDERELKQDEVVGGLQPEKRRRVQKTLAWKHMDDLKQVIQRNCQDADQCILDRGGHLAEAMLVVSLFEDMNCCERHVSLLVRVSVREQHGTDHCGSLWLMTIIHTTSFDSHEFALVA